MNDRHLYKAKRLDNGEWIEGYYLYDGVTGKSYIHAIGNCLNESEKVGEEGCLKPVAFEVEASTLCQCTGLKDKNGKLIWENEKCLITRPCTCAGVHIIYKDACFFGYDKLFGTLIKLCDLKTNGYEIEVVSDSPELLEVGE